MVYMFKDDRLHTDLELIELRKQYKELGACMTGFHYECFSTLEEYKQYCRDELEKLRKEKGKA